MADEEELSDTKPTPGPPPREKRTLVDRLRGRHPRLEKPIWLTLQGRGDRTYDVWVEDPGPNGITLTPPWGGKEQHFLVGEGEGAYNVAFDEVHQVRRVTVYEDMPLAPVYLEKGNWRAVADMAPEVDAYINRVALERAAERGESEETIHPMVWMVFIIGVLSMVTLIMQAIFGG